MQSLANPFTFKTKMNDFTKLICNNKISFSDYVKDDLSKSSTNTSYKNFSLLAQFCNLRYLQNKFFL